MRQSAADVTEESRVVKAVLHGDYNQFPDALRQLISLAPLGFSHPENGQILAAYRASLSNGGNVAAHLEGDLALMLEIYRTSKEVEPIEDVIGDARRLLARACKQRLNQGLSDIDQSPSTAFKVLESLAAESKKVTSVTQDRWTTYSLLDQDYNHSPDALVGLRDGITTRYLCKSSGSWLIGSSGIGKSSLAIQQAFTWALGRPFFGMEPVRPLRILIVQNENDKDDCAEVVRGVCDYLCQTEEDMDAVGERVSIVRCRGLTGVNFISWLSDEVMQFKADMACVDPLLRYAGIDVSRQDQCTRFLNDVIDPMLSLTGVHLNGCHHTGKPKSSKDTKGFSNYDQMYSGLGSSELVNWARAISILRLRDESTKTFELLLAKRGDRSCATDTDGLKTTHLFLKHSDSGVCWEQVPADDVPHSNGQSGSKSKEPRVSLVQQIASMNLYSFCASCIPEGESQREIAQRLENWLAQQNIDAKLTTCRKAIPLLVANQKLLKTDNGLYTNGPQA